MNEWILELPGQFNHARRRNISFLCWLMFMIWRHNSSTQTVRRNLETAECVGAERAQTQVTLLQSSHTNKTNCSQLNRDKIRKDREREKEGAAWTFPQRECSSRGGRVWMTTKGWLSVDGLIKPTVSGSAQASLAQPRNNQGHVASTRTPLPSIKL